MPGSVIVPGARIPLRQLSGALVTAGSTSQISDAAAVVVTSRTKAEELGLPVLAEIGAHGTVAGPDPWLLSQPSNAIAKALQREGRSPADVELYEINGGGGQGEALLLRVPA